MRRIELLAPAGDMDALKTAVKAGADAIYFGGTSFGARAYASNFDNDQIKEACDYAHFHGRKLYMTVNTLFKDHELNRLYDFLKVPYEASLDAVIVQDIGAASFIVRQFPEMEVHASTQMTISNVYGARLCKDMGMTRVVPARELSISELKSIKDDTGLELEVFIHGALCYSYSGQCLLSSIIGGRSGNRGRCAGPCRLPYKALNVSQNGDYLLSPKDLCGLNSLKVLYDIGVDSLKIEGRMKNPSYVASTVASYREALDALYDGSLDHKLIQRLTENMSEIYNRGGFTDGYFSKKNGKNMMSLKRPNHNGVEIGVVERVGKGTIDIKLSKAINKGDVLSLRLKEDEIELTVSKNQESGSKVSLNSPKTKILRSGLRVFRTKNKALIDSLQSRYIDGTLKERIKLSISIKKGKPVKLTGSVNGISHSVMGEIVADAQNKALTADDVMEKLVKLGNTEWFAEASDITIDIDDNVFVPISEVNRLRREVCDELRKKLSDAKKRIIPDWMDPIEFIKVTANYERNDLPDMIVYPTNMEQMKIAAVHDQVDMIILDPAFISNDEMQKAISLLRENKKNIILSMPHIFRNDCEKTFEGFIKSINDYDALLIKNIDEYEYIKELNIDKSLIFEHSLYTYNKLSEAYYRDADTKASFIMPRELSIDELGKLHLQPVIADVYGNIPVMVSAQCTVKNTKGCTACNEVVRLKDRKNIEYDMRSVCRYCYNLLYNNVTYSLHGMSDDIKKLHPTAIRLCFTDENADETLNIIESFAGEYKSGKPFSFEGPSVYTRGHLKRGIE
ncbi:MAG: DUF3656 domain-containing protein [Lachnospiraceae bacterium]|nr:DUF3656 domain-containing protein [Lachnospiraceae bacterium]